MEKEWPRDMLELFECESGSSWRLFEDAILPSPPSELPEWAEAIDNDYEFQESMGAFKCDTCRKPVPPDQFYCEECKKTKVNGEKLKQIMKKREETMKFLREKGKKK